jgi:hypothetical protein
MDHSGDVTASLRADTLRDCLPAGAAGLTTRFTRLGLIHRQGTAVEICTVEALDGSFGCLGLRHLHEPEAFGAPRVTVGNDVDLVHRTIGLEELAQVVIRRTKRKVPNKDIHAKVLYICNMETIASLSEQYAGAQGQSKV